MRADYEKTFENMMENTIDDMYYEMTMYGFKYLPEDMSPTKDGKIIKHSQVTDINGGLGKWEIDHLLNQEYASKRDKENNLNPDKKDFVRKISNDGVQYIIKEVGEFTWN